MREDISNMSETEPVISGRVKTNKTNKNQRDSLQCLKKAVNVSKVHSGVIKRWIGETLQKQLPDDDVAVEFTYELIFGNEEQEVSAAALLEQMEEFLGEQSGKEFVTQLWELLLSAQISPDGIPQQLVEQRKQELEKARDVQAHAEARRILGSARPHNVLSARPNYKAAKFRASHSVPDRESASRKVEGSNHKVTKQRPQSSKKTAMSSEHKTNYNRS